MHHLQEVEGMSLQSVQYCVFDEADQLFEMGFAEQLRAILSGMGDARQTLLFSATLPAALAEFARAGVSVQEPSFKAFCIFPLSPFGHFPEHADSMLFSPVWSEKHHGQQTMRIFPSELYMSLQA